LTTAALVLSITACGGGAVQGPGPGSIGATVMPSPTASGSTPSPGTTPSPTPAPSAGATTKPTATPMASATPSPTTAPTVSASTKIYVANHTKNGTTQVPSVTVYAANASGNVAPLQTISGANTGLAVPQFIAVDASGNIWVTDQGSANNSGSIREFAPNATGNVAPISTITGLNTPEGIFIDAVGDIYVATINAINEYAPGTSGANPTPMNSIGAPANAQTNNSGLAGPYGLRVDRSGNIYVAQEEAIYVFAKGATGNVAPSQTIAGQAALFASDLDVALDSSGNIYCTNFDGAGGTYTINEYAPTATGNTAPSSTITSLDFNEPIGMTFDSAGNMYVANYGNSSIDILVGGGATGAANPTVISGTMTGLLSPYGIAVH
jgi:sugar lactone lactonase YvrE